MAKKDRPLEELDDELARLEAELAALERGEAPEAEAKPKKASMAKRLRGGKAEAVEPEDAEKPRGFKGRLPKVPNVGGLLKKKRGDPEAGDDARGEEAEAEPGTPGEESPGKAGKLLGRFRKDKAAQAQPEETTPEVPEAPEPEAPAPEESEGRTSKLLGRFKRDEARGEPAADPVNGTGLLSELPPDNAGWVREGRAWRRVERVQEKIIVRRRLSESGEVVFEAPASETELRAAEGADAGERAVLKGLLARFKKGKDETGGEPEAED